VTARSDRVGLWPILSPPSSSAYSTTNPVYKITRACADRQSLRMRALKWWGGYFYCSCERNRLAETTSRALTSTTFW